jgi:hypothetical protein
MSTRWLMILISVGGLILAGLLRYRSHLFWIDPVTGSMKVQQQYFLVPISTVIETSSLERWIIRHEGGYSNQWQFLNELSSSLIGGRCRACSLAPAIYELHASGLDEGFVRRASDGRIARFIRVMREALVGVKEVRERLGWSIREAVELVEWLRSRT